MAGNYVLLETISLTQSAASVTFDNIPQSGYTDLKIVVSSRDSTSSGFGSYYTIAFNGGSSYAARYLQGSGSTIGSGTLASLAGISVANSATTNTFCNDEIYIPNYTSSSAKSYSVDSVTENNATGAFQTLVAGSWSGSSVSSITLAPQAGAAPFLANSTFSLYGVAAVGTTPTVAPKATGGNIVANDGTYWYHAFLSSGTFTPQTALTCDALVIAGGGGGGNNYYAGGGGAGGLLSFTNQSVTTACTVTVGAGGTSPSVGNDSQFGALTLVKGGGNGGPISTAGGNGGSGGGGGGKGDNVSPGPAGGTATSGQGNNGGRGWIRHESIGAGGGGGGAGAAGTDGSNNTGGNAGNGSSSFSSWGAVTLTGQNISGTYWYAGGGGGAGAGTAGTGGNGGGGAGRSGFTNVAGIPGLANTGGGGGGANMGDPVQPGGTGGSGIVIIRYAMA